MSYQPPSKKSRSFFIENLLSFNQGGEGAPPENYVEKLSDSTHHIKKFNIVKNYSKFLIKDIPNDPEALLSGIFQYCFDQASTNARNNGVEPEEMGCTLTSELLESDIWIPVRP